MHRIPPDLRKALTADAAAAARWEGLTPIGRRDFASWVGAAARAETRARRAAKACDMLRTGKRRPCCYAIVPMGLYKAISASPAAQARWKDLSPDARRDLVDWIDAAEDPRAREERIAKARSLLAAGKGSPQP